MCVGGVALKIQYVIYVIDSVFFCPLGPASFEKRKRGGREGERVAF